MLVMKWLALARVLGEAEKNTVLKTTFRELRCNAVFPYSCEKSWMCAVLETLSFICGYSTLDK